MSIQTKHFLINDDGVFDADSAARCAAIAATCEQDLATLQGWFGCNFDDSEYGIVVYLPAGVNGGGAFNGGYTTDQSPYITITGTYAPANAPPNGYLRDEEARMEFVAELAEILMDFSGLAWGRGDSMGEGLSIYCAESLHANGYYATGQGPRITNWLNGPRIDYVTNTEQTDQDPASFGCGVLFINYLRYQLSFPIGQIIAAAGRRQFGRPSSLANVFAALTGRPASSAFKEFSDLLQAHVPKGTPFSPRSDNIFPLRDSNRRAVSFGQASVVVNSAPEIGVLTATLKAGPHCSPKPYSYQNVDVLTELTLTGRAFGFANPVFSWSINGVGVLPTSTQQRITVSFEVDDRVPGLGEPVVTVSLPVLFIDGPSGALSQLLIRNDAFVGNGNLIISLTAHEAGVIGDPPTVITDTVLLTTRSYAMSDAWKRDVARCGLFDLAHLDEVVRTIADLLHPDDDHPDIDPATVRALAGATRRYVEAVDEITGGSRGLEGSVAQVFSQARAALPPAPKITIAGVDGGKPMAYRPPLSNTPPTPGGTDNQRQSGH